MRLSRRGIGVNSQQLRGRFMATAAAVAASALGLVACSSGSAEGGDGEFSVWVDAQSVGPTSVRLEEWAKDKDVELDVQTFGDPSETAMLTRWNTGERPDLLVFQSTGGWLPQLNPKETLVDISDQPVIKNSAFPDLVPSIATFEGKQYGALLNYIDAEGLFINKKVFDAAGLRPPTNFEELLKSCADLRAKDINPIFTGGGDKWPLQLLPLVLWTDAIKDSDLMERLNTNEAKWTDPEVMLALKSMREALEANCYNSDILTASFADEAEAMMNDETAMVINGSWYLDALTEGYDRDDINETVGFQPLSQTSDVTTVTTNQAFYVPKTGDEASQELAIDFINWAYQGEPYQDHLDRTGQLPIMEGFEAPADVLEPRKELDAAMKEDSAFVIEQNMRSDFGPFETFLAEMVAGSASPEEVASNLQQEWVRTGKLQNLPGF